ncbi:YqkE family protein [Paenibacillus sp. Leaf72]|uniref:YqkE family protein n=1 Tax=Paenibacillus sp. Leaf72 TaxID=1736234 RepID=UPI0006FA262C|nr:YqkE family protein [Paenibacillus sp. Leaf72]KQO09581.1 hypothetical protein ASF12_31965 [Paenibacillus sp. Leaf72]
MAKKNRQAAPHASKPKADAADSQQATLKDLLSADVLSKLKEQSNALKAAEEQKKQDAAQKANEARKQEQKRLENDMEYLLNNSKPGDWKKYK